MFLNSSQINLSLTLRRNNRPTRREIMAQVDLRPPLCLRSLLWGRWGQGIVKCLDIVYNSQFHKFTISQVHNFTISQVHKFTIHKVSGIHPHERNGEIFRHCWKITCVSKIGMTYMLGWYQDNCMYVTALFGT